VDASQDYVLYWMLCHRRCQDNQVLQRAVQHCCTLRKPLLILDALRLDYPWASRRSHRFVLDGMASVAHDVALWNSLRAKDLAEAGDGIAGVMHYPFVELESGAGRGLFAALAARAAVVVADDAFHFFFPRAIQAALRDSGVRFELVDDHGVMPLSLAQRAFPLARMWRRYFQSNASSFLFEQALQEPLAELPSLPGPKLDERIIRRWPARSLAQLEGPELLRSLPLLGPEPVAQQGGEHAALQQLFAFVGHKLSRYAEDSGHPDLDGCSALSSYLHFGQLSSRRVLREVLREASYQRPSVWPVARGQREGWWGTTPSVEAFLEQLIVWRELGYNQARFDPSGWTGYASIPTWAQRTLELHRGDPRELLTLEQLREARSPDPLWNACQRQLLREGRIHNALRMLWGKRFLEWTPSAQDALVWMEELNNLYALDGRDPNSYSGLLWVLGKFDRAWGPERPIFGTVRYMSSTATQRKRRVKAYLARYAA
jgi:deoxyribodipyrimidine photo-lyase